MAECCFRGLIPAHAGSTIVCRCAVGALRAHPRSRGEHSAWSIIMSAPRGSSPLTRGALAIRTYAPIAGGLIPAHAGSTSPPSPWCRSPRAHPRSRGEHTGTFLTWPPLPGSSPLTRGALRAGVNIAGVVGLIPAHAGSTALRLPARATARAHPRSRGEHDGSDGTTPR